MSGVRVQGSVVGGPSAKMGRGRYPSAPAFFFPLGEPGFQPRACPGREKRQTCVAGAHRQPQPVCGGEEGGGAQVARLSAGRPAMRIWELLLLRMES